MRDLCLMNINRALQIDSLRLPDFQHHANKYGVKTILIIGTLGCAPYSASLYVNNRYGIEWLVLFGGVTCGIAPSALWAFEGAIALGYTEVKDRGKFSKSLDSQ
jgi:hypothetical protein